MNKNAFYIDKVYLFSLLIVPGIISGCNSIRPYFSPTLMAATIRGTNSFRSTLMYKVAKIFEILFYFIMIGDWMIIIIIIQQTWTVQRLNPTTFPKMPFKDVVMCLQIDIQNSFTNSTEKKFFDDFVRWYPFQLSANIIHIVVFRIIFWF